MSWLKPLNPPIRDWSGKRVWIVGASSGIGAALAQALANRGACLALSARRREALLSVAQACGDAVVLPMDVTQAEDYQRALRELLVRWGEIDLVVLNAGTYRPTRAWELSTERIRETIDTNLLGVLDGVAATAPRLLAQGHGALAIVGSVAAYVGLPKAAVYGPSKAALLNLAESLYLDLHPRGLGVYLISPGFVATPLTAQNDFTMPGLIQPDQAARAIIDGFAAGAFEIHFPRRFTRMMKLLRLLPYRLYFKLAARTGENG